MPSAIELLPPELLVSILEEVHTGDNIISSLRVCRRWTTYILPFIYRDLFLSEKQLGPFLVAFDRHAASTLTRSLTVRLGYTQPIIDSCFNGWLQQLATDFLPHVHGCLESLSLSVLPGQSSDLMISPTSIAALLAALPVSCVDLELDVILRDQKDAVENHVHVCDKLRPLMTRMRRVRISLDPICCSLLGEHEPAQGFRATSLPATLSLTISCVKSFFAHRLCPGVRPGNARTAPTLEPLWESVTGALQCAAKQGQLQGDVVFMGGLFARNRNNMDLNYHRTLLRCHASHDGIATSASPIVKVTPPVALRLRRLYYIRTSEGGFVVKDKVASDEVSEGFLWRTSRTGSRLPEDRCKGHALVKDPGEGDVWTETQWRRRYPMASCSLWRNEELAGMSLIEVEKKPGTDIRWAVEATPPGFYRIDNGLNLAKEEEL